MSVMKCSGIDCQIKKQCYRFLSKGPYWQELGVWKYNQETKSCAWFMKNGGSKA